MSDETDSKWRLHWPAGACPDKPHWCTDPDYTGAAAPSTPPTQPDREAMTRIVRERLHAHTCVRHGGQRVESQACADAGEFDNHWHEYAALAVAALAGVGALAAGTPTRLPNACKCGDCYHPAFGPDTDGDPCYWCQDCGCYKTDHTLASDVDTRERVLHPWDPTQAMLAPTPPPAEDTDTPCPYCGNTGCDADCDEAFHLVRDEGNET